MRKISGFLFHVMFISSCVPSTQYPTLKTLPNVSSSALSSENKADIDKEKTTAKNIDAPSSPKTILLDNPTVNSPNSNDIAQSEPKSMGEILLPPSRSPVIGSSDSRLSPAAYPSPSAFPEIAVTPAPIS